ncbi:interferon gamma [Rhynchocyon petersi]
MKYASYFLALQLCIILGSSGCYGQGTLLSEVQKLKEYLNATDSSVANGGPLFLNILEKWKEESDKKIIQSQIVSFYFKIFENLKDHQSINKSMGLIKEDLFVRFFNSSQSKRDDFLTLIKTPVNDRAIQRKAVSELFKVLEDLPPRSNQKKRKRRQNVFRGRKVSD